MTVGDGRAGDLRAGPGPFFLQVHRVMAVVGNAWAAAGGFPYMDSGLPECRHSPSGLERLECEAPELRVE